MRPEVHLAWLTATTALHEQFASRLKARHPGQELLVVAEFPVEGAHFIAYQPKQSFAENLRAIRAALGLYRIVRTSMLLAPRVPFWTLRLIAFRCSGLWMEFYDDALIRRSLPGQCLRVTAASLRWHMRRDAFVPRWLRRVRNPGQASVPVYAKFAGAAARFRRARAPLTVPSANPLPLLDGITVLIPSRNGLALLRECLPRIEAQRPDQIVIVDNGSSDSTAREFASHTIVTSAEPLSFARAMNRGLSLVKHRRVLLLNNDMLVDPGFLPALERAFEQVPGLFCATAQIRFPAGLRREETGKTVFRQDLSITEFPVRCEEPLAGEDGTWVLYGSGGCSLYDTVKLRALGGLNEALEPAYVEDLDAGFRAWQRGWATVFCARATVEHRHRSTTARYWTPEQIDTMVQLNYLRFLASAIADRELFRRLWLQAIRRLHLNRSQSALRGAIQIPLRMSGPLPDKEAAQDEHAILVLNSGDVAVFPGSPGQRRPLIVIAAPYIPFPLSHGGAVRIYNLMREGAAEYAWVLISFAEQWDTPPKELLALCKEVVLVRRRGSHHRVASARPDTVEEFDAPAFHAALRQTISKWHPEIVQLEWTQMAQYAADCHPAKTILVEHDITFDLYEQMAERTPGDVHIEAQLERWRTFERAAWSQVNVSVAMSEKDRKRIGTERARTIPNGVDTRYFQPSPEQPEPGRLLFIGSFAHHPNRSAIEWFVREVWPLLNDLEPRLHIIAGNQPEPIPHPRIFVEGFVADVRPAYWKASVVIAPLLASAGTNIKVLEALAMGKPLVSTTAGVNGLDVPGVVIADTAVEFANALRTLLTRPPASQPLADIEHYSWRASAKAQSSLYRELMGNVSAAA